MKMHTIQVQVRSSEGATAYNPLQTKSQSDESQLWDLGHR